MVYLQYMKKGPKWQRRFLERGQGPLKKFHVDIQRVFLNTLECSLG